MPFWRFLTRLLHEWYGVLAGLLGLLAVIQQVLEALGYRPLVWSKVSPSVVTLALLLAALGAVVYGAYLVTLEALAEGRALGRTETTRLGDLRFDINEAATGTSSSRDETRRCVIVHGIMRSSAPSSARVTSLQLVDMDRRTYRVASFPQGLDTTVGHITFSSQGFFEPNQILILEPNRPREVGLLFVADGGAWGPSISTGSFSIVLQDDLGRSGQGEFSCRIHR